MVPVFLTDAAFYGCHHTGKRCAQDGLVEVSLGDFEAQLSAFDLKLLQFNFLRSCTGTNYVQVQARAFNIVIRLLLRTF